MISASALRHFQDLYCDYIPTQARLAVIPNSVDLRRFPRPEPGARAAARMAVKPTSSILTPRKTVTKQGEDTDIRTKGRHDPCVGIRGAPVAEAMMACVLADHLLRHRGQTGR